MSTLAPILRIAPLCFLACSMAHAELLVYEAFDYPAGNDVDTPLDGGTGFLGAWSRSAEYGTITVYDESATTEVNNTAGGELTWDGVVNNIPTRPTSGSRFIGLDPFSAALSAQRTLTQSAGALAGEDQVLWASVVWHQEDSNYGRHIGFTLGTDGLSNRSRNVSKTGDFGAGLGNAIGVGGAINTYAVTPIIFANGNIAATTTAGATNVSRTLDNIVILKFVFADGVTPDTVYAYRFTENDILTEATFNTNAISAFSVIDQDTLNILSFSQSRGSSGVDEIRLGSTFEDVTTAVIETQPLEVTDLAYDTTQDETSLTWKSNPNRKYAVFWSEDLENFISSPTYSAIPAHSSNTTTTLGPFANPLPNAERLFYRIGPSDEVAPTLVKTKGVGNTIKLTFSEAMYAPLATDPANYTITEDGAGNVGITGITSSEDGKVIHITTATPLTPAKAHTVTMNNLTDPVSRELGNGTTGDFLTWDDNPTGVKVFILAGQSNMVGYGRSEEGYEGVVGAIGSLRYEVNTDPANYGHLGDGAGNWNTRTDVKVWWNKADIGGGSSINKGDLNVGYASSSTRIGPEYGFGWVMGEHFAEPVLIIKVAWGGKSLRVDYRPPSTVAERGGKVGPYYTQMLQYVRQCLDNLDTQFPEFAGMGYQIAGIGWHQGWNDGSNEASVEYEDNLVNLITDLREEFGKPNLPFSCANTGIRGYAASGVQLTVLTAQLNVGNPALYPEFAGNVFTADTRDFYRLAGVSPMNQDYHWNHNGESYYLIGNAMGNGMVDLLTP